MFNKKEEKCLCGHSHEHNHSHEGKCWCGHDHRAEERTMADEGTCCHEVCADHESSESGEDDGGGGEESHQHGILKTKTAHNESILLLKNLGCANCAAKMEEKIRLLPQVDNAAITFVTKELRVESCADIDTLIPKINEVCRSVEEDVEAVLKEEKSNNNSEFKIYKIKNLDCANCAAKMEALINKMDGVDEAVVSFASKQLRLKAENADMLIPEIKRECRKIEEEVDFETEESAKNNEADKEEKGDLIKIGIGAAVFIAVEVYQFAMGAESFSLPMILLLALAYIVLGGDVLLTAFKNILKGQVFDENFLMSIATLGAFAIKEYPEAVGVMLFFKVGEYFEHIAVERSRSRIMEAVDLRPETVTVIANGKTVVKPAGKAKIGDILLVRPGDRIPLDGVVVEGESRIDTSAVTGENVPVKAEKGTSVLSGCVNVSAVIKIRAEKELKDSMVTRILNSVESAAAGKPSIDSFITRFARVYTPVVVGIAVFTAFAIPFLTGQSYYKWIYTALSFLVMSCPCALVLSVPLAFFCGIGAASQKGILFKGGIVMEALSTIKAVVMDKTGTITKGDFAVKNIEAVEGIGENQLLKICSSCEGASSHPIAESIVQCAKEKGLSFDVCQSIEEISGKGIKAVMDGKQVLCGNLKLMKDFGVNVPDIEQAGGGTEVLTAYDGKYIGRIVISDTIKSEAADAVRKIKSKGIVTAMLTGDNEKSAEAVAAQTGIDEVHARLLPEDKLNELKKIREKHGSVMFVGDGINDAPVLAGADAGAAMGSGADAAIEAADVVFMKSDMEAIPSAIEISKRAVSVSRQNVVFAIGVKVIVMLLGLLGIYSNMWLAVFADTGVALICILNSIKILYEKS